MKILTEGAGTTGYPYIKIIKLDISSYYILKIPGKSKTKM